MAKMVVIYNRPVDVEAFDRHYFNVHIPLAKTLPGLKSYEASRGPIVRVAGKLEPYLIATLHFESMEAIKKAFASPEGIACAADRRFLAPKDSDVQIYLFDDREL